MPADAPPDGPPGIPADAAAAVLPIDRVDAVIFDTDGVITDTARVHAMAWKSAARRLDVPPERAAVVEEALAGVIAGRNGGFGLVIGHDRGGHAGELRANGADLVIADLAELRLGRRRIVRSPARR